MCVFSGVQCVQPRCFSRPKSVHQSCLASGQTLYSCLQSVWSAQMPKLHNFTHKRALHLILHKFKKNKKKHWVHTHAQSKRQERYVWVQIKGDVPWKGRPCRMGRGQPLTWTAGCTLISCSVSYLARVMKLRSRMGHGAQKDNLKLRELWRASLNCQSLIHTVSPRHFPPRWDLSSYFVGFMGSGGKNTEMSVWCEPISFVRGGGLCIMVLWSYQASEPDLMIPSGQDGENLCPFMHRNKRILLWSLLCTLGHRHAGMEKKASSNFGNKELFQFSQHETH